MIMIIIINTVNDCFPSIVQEFAKVQALGLNDPEISVSFTRDQLVDGSYLTEHLFIRYTEHLVFRTIL